MCLNFSSVVLVSDFRRLGSDHYGARLNLLGLVLSSSSWFVLLRELLILSLDVWQYLADILRFGGTQLHDQYGTVNLGFQFFDFLLLILLQEQQFLLNGFNFFL